MPLVLAWMLVVGSAARPAPAQPAAAPSPSPAIVVDTFEDDAPGTFPDGWVYVTPDRDIRTYEEMRRPGTEVVVRREAGNRFVRFMTRDAVARYTKRNGTDFQWTVSAHPKLRWRWRAVELPEGASERGDNDTGAALYVTFGTDWLGRPKSLKYTYSSALPVGTMVDFGSLKVIVVSSRPDDGTGRWRTITRDVVADYREAFGEDPPSRPAGITLWSDTDTTHGRATVDFDALMLLPASVTEPMERNTGSRDAGMGTR